MLERYAFELWKEKNDQTKSFLDVMERLHDDVVMENVWSADYNNELTFSFK